MQGTTYQLLTAHTIVALSAQLGLARTFGEEQLLVPKPDRFFAGGRLLPARVRRWTRCCRTEATPSSSEASSCAATWWARSGRPPSPRRGTSTRSSPTCRCSDLRYTAGLGLRYKSAVGPLRFDWGYKLDRLPGESPYHLHFTIGNAF